MHSPPVFKDWGSLQRPLDLFVNENRYSNHDFDSFREILKTPSYFVYVAEENDRLIGFITFSIRSMLRYPRPIAQLEDLFILEEFRKKGLGKKLIEIMESKINKLNCYRIYIESQDNRKIAHKFYQKLGYKKMGLYFQKNI